MLARVIDGTRQRGTAMAAALSAALFLGALAGCSGNGLTYERAYPYRVQTFFQPAASNAFVSLATPPKVGEQGTMTGYIHGWPFVHGQNEGTAPASLFSYVMQFTVTKTGSEVAARGVRTIYFNSAGAPTTFDNLAAFSSGTPVITERAALSLAFDSNYQRATVALHTRQISARSFFYQGKQITPPGAAERTASLTGNYAGTYGGFLMH